MLFSNEAYQSNRNVKSSKMVKEMKRVTIAETEYEKIRKAERETKSKYISKKLRVLMLRYEGKSNQEIVQAVGCSVRRVDQLLREYKDKGIEEYTRSKYKGNHRSLSEEEEKEILDAYTARAKSGQIVTVQEIKKTFDERIGKDTGRSYIYMVLARHGWRKTTFRSQHPQKASVETIKVSKKSRMS